jgi:multidrug efflux system outer membrane protein
MKAAEPQATCSELDMRAAEAAATPEGLLSARAVPAVWMSRLAPLLAGFAAALLAGCAATVEPPAHRLPAAPMVFKSAAVPAAASDAAGADTPRMPADGAWWQVFGDPVLNDLVSSAERGNTSLAAAAARVAAARAVLGAARAQGRPQLQASASAGRQGGPLVNAAGSEGTLLTAGVQLAYEADLSGRLAASQDAATLDAQARDSLLRSARLLVQAEVAHTYLALRATDAERALARRNLQAWQQTLQISEARLQQGGLSELAVQRLRAEVQGTQVDTLALQRRRGELENTLALLLGDVASGFVLPELAGWAPAVPAIPHGIPSDVLVRRPDVAAAARQLQAAHARRTGAERAWWPSLVLTASGGQASALLADLMRTSMRAFSLGALLATPLLDGGRRAADAAQAQALEAEALAHSRQSVLQAFKDVEDQLLALQVLALQADHRAQASAAATRAAAMQNARWRNGVGSHLELLDAERTAWRSQAAVLQTQVERAQATVGLIRALGGGWGEPANATEAVPLGAAAGPAAEQMAMRAGAAGPAPSSAR